MDIKILGTSQRHQVARILPGYPGEETLPACEGSPEAERSQAQAFGLRREIRGWCNLRCLLDIKGT